MVTANLSWALQGFVTSVAVGKDAISRTGTVTFERLLDQVGGAAWWGGMARQPPAWRGSGSRSGSGSGRNRLIRALYTSQLTWMPPCFPQMVLALARTRLPKMRVLFGLRSPALRDRPQEIFCPVEEIPAEALRSVRQ